MINNTTIKINTLDLNNYYSISSDIYIDGYDNNSDVEFYQYEYPKLDIHDIDYDLNFKQVMLELATQLPSTIDTCNVINSVELVKDSLNIPKDRFYYSDNCTLEFDINTVELVKLSTDKNKDIKDMLIDYLNSEVKVSYDAINYDMHEISHEIYVNHMSNIQLLDKNNKVLKVIK